MAGKHAAPSTGAKKTPLIIAIAVALAAAVGTCVFFFVLKPFDNKGDPAAQPAALPSAATAATEPSLEIPTNPRMTEQPAGTEEPEPSTTIDMVLPSGEGEISHFNGSYVPAHEAEDVATGEKVSLRDLFGTGFSSAVMTFNEDGTFTDTLSTSGKRSGMYNVQDGGIKATYLPDENMDITVTQWDDSGKVPVRYYVIYHTTGDSGYKVFFLERV